MKFPTRIFIILLFCSSAIAQSPSAILKKAEKALGGTKLLKNISSRQQTGIITRLSDGSSGNFRMRATRPNRFYFGYDIGGFEIESGYNGKSGWSRDSREGLRTLTGDSSLRFQAEALYRNTLWRDYKKQKSRIVSGGKAEINGKMANLVILTTAKGVSMRLFFDVANGLPVREEIPAGDSVKTLDYADYRMVSGLNQPFSIRMATGEDTFDIAIKDVAISQKISPAEFDFPGVSGEPLPEIRSLLAELQANEDRIDNILDTYSYLQRIIKRELGKDGILRETESETYQMSFYKGNRISRLIEKNGLPLTQGEQAKADREAQKDAEDIEKKIAKAEKETEKGGQTSDEDRRISIAEVLRASNLLNPRRERFRGRDVIVFDFEPNPDFDFKKAKSMLKFFGKTAGVMWIDEKDKQVARLEAFLFDSYKIGGGILAKLKKGATFTLEQERMNDEIWLPSTADINLSVRVLLVKGIDINQIIRSYDYRKFTTEVKDARIDEIKKP